MKIELPEPPQTSHPLIIRRVRLKVPKEFTRRCLKTQKVPVGAGPQSTFYNPQDDKVYVANFEAGTVTILTAGAGIEEMPTAELRTAKGATIVRGVLYAGHDRNPPGDFGSCPKSVLLDISGREVLDLAPGANDVRALVPGVYFVRAAQAQGRAQVVAKVIIAR